MCLEVRNNCEPVLKRFNFPWPPVLDCMNLPEKKDHQTLCMEAPSGGVADEIFGSIDDKPYGGDFQLPGNLPGGTQHPDWAKLMEEFRRGNDGTGLQGLGGRDRWKGKGGSSGSTSLPPNSKLCGDRFVMIDRLQERWPDGACAPRCNMEVLFREEDKRFAFIWTTVWSSISLFTAILTVLTFFVDTSRFPYPERPIIFLAMCFIPLSIAYLLRVAVRTEVLSCDRVPTESGIDGTPFIVQDGFENMWCVVVFVLVYYFQMASALWWLTLAVTWFLAAGRKWGAEAIQRLGNYFHVVAWTVPAIQTIVVLVMRRVDGDELLGMCYVGNRDGLSRMSLVIAPLLVYLVLGSILILAGFAAMLRIRADLRRHEPPGGNIRKLEKLMAKIGLFAVLYALPAACVIGAHFYEHVNQSQWLHQARHTSCDMVTSRNGGDGVDASDNGEFDLAGERVAQQQHQQQYQCAPMDRSIPNVEVFMLRHFMMLVVGITSGMWVWSAKTLRTWRNFCSTSHSRRKTALVPRSTGSPGPSGTPSAMQGLRMGSIKTSEPSCSYLKCPTGGPVVHISAIDKTKMASRI